MNLLIDIIFHPIKVISCWMLLILLFLTSIGIIILFFIMSLFIPDTINALICMLCTTFSSIIPKKEDKK